MEELQYNPWDSRAGACPYSKGLPTTQRKAPEELTDPSRDYGPEHWTPLTTQLELPIKSFAAFQDYRA